MIMLKITFVLLFFILLEHNNTTPAILHYNMSKTPTKTCSAYFMSDSTGRV